MVGRTFSFDLSNPLMDCTVKTNNTIVSFVKQNVFRLRHLKLGVTVAMLLSIYFTQLKGLRLASTLLSQRQGKIMKREG